MVTSRLKNVEMMRKAKCIMYGEKGEKYFSKYGNTKKISREKIYEILMSFIENSITEVKIGTNNEGGYLDYYFMNADKYTDLELVDYAMFFKTIEYINAMIFNENLNGWKYFTAEDLFRFSYANMFFEYKFRSKKFQRWQKRLFNILSLKKLPK